jgi:hypothetical protein
MKDRLPQKGQAVSDQSLEKPTVAMAWIPTVLFVDDCKIGEAVASRDDVRQGFI